MSTEDLITKLGERTDRSRFLRRAAVATAGVTAAMLGFASDAHALYYIKCCELCRQPGCGGWDPICSWCWYCCHTDHRQYKCCEYYSAGNCNGSCVNVFCSTYQDWGTCLAPGPNLRSAVPVP